MIVRKARRSFALVEGLGSEGLHFILDESMAFLKALLSLFHGGMVGYYK